MTPNVAKRARRLLEAVRPDSGERVYPGYISLEKGRASWWTDDVVPASCGEAIGVHELETDVRSGAVIFTSTHLGVCANSDVQWASYSDIQRWDPLAKDGSHQATLRVHTTTGQLLELPFNRPQAFAFVHFLSRAMWEHRRRD